jgi:hypothetical protein
MCRGYPRNAVVEALIRASIIRCGGYIKKPCTGRHVIFNTHRSRR